MNNESLQINKEQTPEGIKFVIKGQISSSRANDLRVTLEEALKSGEVSIILNMLEVGYLCSVGISIILNAYKTARQSGGTLVIEQPSENVRKVLIITSLDEMLIQ